MISRTILHFAGSLIVVPSLSAAPVVNESGDLENLLVTITIPSAESPDKYRLPTGLEMTAFRAALQHILDGDLQAAADVAVDANYDVVSYTDNVSNDVFALLREKNSNQHWGGLYAVDLTPERTLVVECPHPLYDGVRAPAADMFLATNATAYLQAGTHRNNSLIESECDGDLGGDPYRISDMAHAPDSLFQAAHNVIEAHFTRTVSLSLHGMAEESDPADVVISNGTVSNFIGNSLSRSLADRMNEILGEGMDPRIAVSHQETGENPGLSGSTNTQGRATNGSTNPCTVDAPRAIFPERFIHMECDPDVRDGDPSNWAFVIEALNDLVPLFSDPEPDLPTGDITITEFMADPVQTGDGSGEYLELFNHTGSPINFNGWTLFDRGGNSAGFTGIVPPGDLFVVGVSNDLNSGAQGGGPDAAWSDIFGDFNLNNNGDVIYLLDPNGDLVASVAYDDGASVTPGIAMELTTGNAHLNGQTVKADYFNSTTAFGTDLGSPGTRGGTLFPLLTTPLTASVSGGDFEISFKGARAVTYVLWKSLQLSGWVAASGQSPFIGNGEDGSFQFALPNDPKTFYYLDYDYAAPE